MNQRRSAFVQVCEAPGDVQRNGVAAAVAVEFIRPPLDLLAPDPIVKRSAAGKFKDEADLVRTLSPGTAVEKDDVGMSEAVLPVVERTESQGVSLVASQLYILYCVLCRFYRTYGLMILISSTNLSMSVSLGPNKPLKIPRPEAPPATLSCLIATASPW